MKRWYQLSMLQMLVAMAVSAAIIPPNVFAKRDEGNRKSSGFKVVFIRWGWPLVHCTGMEFTNVVDGKDEVSLVRFFSIAKMFANIGIGAALVVCCIIGAGKFAKQKPCPSPKT